MTGWFRCLGLCFRLLLKSFHSLALSVVPFCLLVALSSCYGWIDTKKYLLEPYRELAMFPAFLGVDRMCDIHLWSGVSLSPDRNTKHWPSLRKYLFIKIHIKLSSAQLWRNVTSLVLWTLNVTSHFYICQALVILKCRGVPICRYIISIDSNKVSVYTPRQILHIKV